MPSGRGLMEVKVVVNSNTNNNNNDDDDNNNNSRLVDGLRSCMWS